MDTNTATTLEFWDRDGQPISLEHWSLLKSEIDYRLVATDSIETGDGNVEVITAWLGTDQGDHFADETGNTRPLIFGTILKLAGTDTYIGSSERFTASETDAKTAHDELCDAVRCDPAIAVPSEWDLNDDPLDEGEDSNDT